MVLKWGFTIDEQINYKGVTTAKLITPPKVPDVITLSLIISDRFMLIGTKPEILEWLHSYPDIILKVRIFDDDNVPPSIHFQNIVIDLLADAHMHRHLADIVNPLHHPDAAFENVRLEFRISNPKTDDLLEPLFRLIVTSGSKLSEIVDSIEEEWNKLVYPSIWDEVKEVASLPYKVLREDNNNSA
ncbi:hypothetical protein G9A89_014043 [Geosiphon pyriformis]|nr:hypothetical protein G9A89_014043 [Geosiphon pyriformis]